MGPVTPEGKAARAKAREGNADREYYGEDYDWDSLASAAVEAHEQALRRAECGCIGCSRLNIGEETMSLDFMGCKYR